MRNKPQCSLFVVLLAVALAPTARAQGPCTGWIAVESTPVAGVSVALDGADTGSQTPVTLKEIACGSHNVLGTLPLYKPGKQTVTVRAQEVAKARLELVANFGSLQIESQPAGARLELDGKKIGEAPIRLAQLAAGSHNLKAELPDYHVSTRVVRVTPGKEISLQIQLTPAFGSIRVTAKPEAQVALDGDAVGSTPLVLNRILSGPHSIRVARQHYLPFETRLVVGDGRQADVAAKLKPNFGTVAVAVTPPGASVQCDGRELGVAPLEAKLAPGEHVITVTGPDETYLPQERKLVVKLLGQQRLELTLAVRTGTLLIDTKPYAAEIELDGRPVGKAPLALKDLRIGAHLLAARLAGKSVDGRVEVREGLTSIAELNLNEPTKSVLRVDEASAQPAQANLAREQSATPEPKEATPPPLAPVLADAAAQTAATDPAPDAVAPASQSDTSHDSVEVSPRPLAPLPPPAVVAARPMSKRRLLGWIGAGTAGVAAVTAAVLIGMSGAAQSDADQTFAAFKQEPPGARRNELEQSYLDLDREASAQFGGGMVAAAIAAAAAGAAVYCFVSEPAANASQTEPKASLGLAPTAGGGMVSVQARF